MKKVIISIVCLVLLAAVAVGGYVGGYVGGSIPNDQELQQQYQAGYDSRDAEIAHLNTERAEQVATLNAQIVTLQEQLDNAVDPDEIAAIKTQIAELQNQMEALQQGSGGSSVTQSLYMHSLVLNNFYGASVSFRIYVNLLLDDATPLTKENFIEVMDKYTNAESDDLGGIIVSGIHNDKSVAHIIHSSNNSGFFINYSGTNSFMFLSDDKIGVYDCAVVKVL